MSGIDDRHWSSDGPHMSEAGPQGRWRAATQFLFSVIGLALITFAAFPLHLQPGAISLLYLIVVVFVSLRAGFVSSVAVSLIAVYCLHYYFLRCSRRREEEPAGHRGNGYVL